MWLKQFIGHKKEKNPTFETRLTIWKKPHKIKVKLGGYIRVM
jgi:hypothetical protein